MEPFSWAMIAVQAVGALMSASSQSRAYKQQAAVADYNATVARQQAQTSLQVSAANQEAQRRQARQFLGSQRAAAAQAGIGTGGQVADLLDRSETLAELDVLNTAYEGQLQARGYTTQAEIDDFNARAYRKQAKSAMTTGLFNAGASVLGGMQKLGTMTPSSSSSGAYFGGLRMGSGLGLRSYGSTGLRYG